MPYRVTTEPTLTGKKLFAYLTIDEIALDKELIHKALHGDTDALSFIAGLYYNKKEYQKAIGWYTLAGNQNHLFSQVQLGHIYHTGLGRANPDYDLALNWYIMAHNNGSATATNNIGCMYAKGHGVPHSYTSAMKWYEAAAYIGSSNAQYNLGSYYENGNAGQINKALALKWYERSSANGFERAKRAAKRLNKESIHLFTKQMYSLMEKQINKQFLAFQDYVTRLESTGNQLIKAESEKIQLKNDVRSLK